MNYELKSSIHKQKISLPVRILILIVIILLFLYIFAPLFLSSILTYIISPIWRINKEEISNNISENTKDILILKLNQENKELKELMGRKIENNFVLAYILKKPPFTAYDSLILDIGLNKNVKKGNQVYGLGDILIGEIAEVFENTSRVKLYSSYGEKYDVFIGEKNIQATATGRGGGSFEAILPRDIDIKVGDLVNIPNISNSTFATVGKIISDPTRAFSTIIFSQPINIYEQKFVKIYENNISD